MLASNKVLATFLAIIAVSVSIYLVVKSNREDAKRKALEEELLQIAIELENLGDIDEAIKTYETLYHKRSCSSHCLTLLGTAHLRQKNHPSALLHCKEAMLLAKNDCDNIEALSCVSKAYCALKQYDRHFEYQLLRHRCLALPSDESLHLFDHLLTVNDTKNAIQVATTYTSENTTLLAQFSSSLHDMQRDDLLSLPLFGPPKTVVQPTLAEEEKQPQIESIPAISNEDQTDVVESTIKVESIVEGEVYDALSTVPDDDDQSAAESSSQQHIQQEVIFEPTAKCLEEGEKVLMELPIESVLSDDTHLAAEQVVYDDQTASDNTGNEQHYDIAEATTLDDSATSTGASSEAFESVEVVDQAVVEEEVSHSVPEAEALEEDAVVIASEATCSISHVDEATVIPAAVEAGSNITAEATTVTSTTQEECTATESAGYSIINAAAAAVDPKASNDTSTAVEVQPTPTPEQEQEQVQPQLTETEQRQIRMANTYINIAQTYFLKEDYPACLKQLTLALKKCSWAPEALLLRGMTNIKLATINSNPSLLQDAVVDLTQVYTKNVHVNVTLSDAAKGWLTQIATLHLRQGNNVKPTIDIFTLFLQHEGKLELETYWQLAIAYEKLQNYNLAVNTLQLLEHTLSANSTAMTAELQAYWLRNVLPKIGKLAEQADDLITAQTYYQRGIESKFISSNTIAEMYFRHNQSNLAIGYYQQALHEALLDHANETATTNMTTNTLKTTAATVQIGQLYRRLGDIYASINSSVEAQEQALFHYQQAMAYGVDDKAIRRYFATHLSSSSLPVSLSPLLDNNSTAPAAEELGAGNDTASSSSAAAEAAAAAEEELKPKKAFSGGSRWVVKRAVEPILDDEYDDYFSADAQHQQQRGSRLSGGGGSSALEAALMQNIHKQQTSQDDTENEYGAGMGVDGRSGNSFFEQYQELEQRQKAEEEAEKKRRHQSLMMD